MSRWRDVLAGCVARWHPGPRFAYTIVVIVATAVVSFATYEAKQSYSVASESRRVAASSAVVAQDNRALIEQVKRQKASLEQLSQEEADSCANFETLKAAVNRFHGTIRRLITQARDRAQHVLDNPQGIPPVQLKQAHDAVVESDELLANLSLVSASCSQDGGNPGGGH